MRRVLLRGNFAQDADHMVMLDCRGFQDPQSDRHHLGLRAKNVAAFVKHTAFPQWLKDAAARVRRAWQPGARVVIVT
eukprot:7374715-Lingulodinium_polyedra.AAC.1